MKTIFAKGYWEVYGKPLPWFVEQVATAGWQATEIHLGDSPESHAEVRRLHREAGLGLIAQITTVGATPEHHLTSLVERYQDAVKYEPLLVNCHTGADFFSFDDNRRLFDAAIELADKEGVPLLHETHRQRALFTAPLCQAYLEAVPGLRLCVDFSHLFCVHESDLGNQPQAVDAIIAAADHIHARVGFAEGPQVGDPRNPTYRDWLDLSVGLWTRIRERQAGEGRAAMTITPEFGPPPYAPLRGITSEPVAEPWEVNHWMRDELIRRWQLANVRDPVRFQ